jgi:hypothetical protein
MRRDSRRLEPNFGREIALLFIASMTASGIGFAIFLVETRLATRSLRIRPEVLAHAPDEQQALYFSAI